MSSGCSRTHSLMEEAQANPVITHAGGVQAGVLGGVRWLRIQGNLGGLLGGGDVGTET